MEAGLLALSIRKFAPTINHGPLSAPRNFFYVSLLRERSGRRMPPAERSALLYVLVLDSYPRRPLLGSLCTFLQDEFALISVPLDTWVGRYVRITTPRHNGTTGLVHRTGNGWVNLQTAVGDVAKRAYDLVVIPEERASIGNGTGGMGKGDASRGKRYRGSKGKSRANCCSCLFRIPISTAWSRNWSGQTLGVLDVFDEYISYFWLNINNQRKHHAQQSQSEPS